MATNGLYTIRSVDYTGRPFVRLCLRLYYFFFTALSLTGGDTFLKKKISDTFAAAKMPRARLLYAAHLLRVQSLR